MQDSQILLQDRASSHPATTPENTAQETGLGIYLRKEITPAEALDELNAIIAPFRAMGRELVSSIMDTPLGDFVDSFRALLREAAQFHEDFMYLSEEGLRRAERLIPNDSSHQPSKEGTIASFRKDWEIINKFYLQAGYFETIYPFVVKGNEMLAHWRLKRRLRRIKR